MPTLGHAPRARLYSGLALPAGALLLLLLGILVSTNWKVGLALCALVALVILGIVCATPQRIGLLLSALVASTFVTRFKFEVLGLHFRPEDGLVLSALLALAICPRPVRPLGQTLSRTPVVLLIAYVLWTALVSIAMSPKPQASLAIAGWLALDVTILVVLITGFSRAEQLEDVGMLWACVAFGIADILFFAGSTIGFGVQTDAVTHAKAAYGLSYEANLLASTAAMWLFLAISSPKVRTHTTYKLVLPLGFFALIVSFTRAADAALVLGLIVWALFAGYRARRVLVRRLGVLLVVGAAFLIAFPSLSAPVVKKLSEVTNVYGTTGKVRVTTSSEALHDLHELNWVIGLGANSFGQRHTDYTRPDQDISGYLSVLPLSLLYDGGLVAIVLLGAAFLYLKPWRLTARARAAGLLVVYGVASLTTSPFWLGSTWVIVALALLAERQPSKATVPRRALVLTQAQARRARNMEHVGRELVTASNATTMIDHGVGHELATGTDANAMTDHAVEPVSRDLATASDASVMIDHEAPLLDAPLPAVPTTLEEPARHHRSSFRALLMSASATAILQGASNGLGFVLAVLLARFLGSVGYGRYALAFAWSMFLITPGILGLDRFLVRGIAVYEVNEQWPLMKGLLRRTNELVLGTSSAIAVCGTIVGLTVMSPSLRGPFCIAMILVPVTTLTLLRQGAMQAFGRVVKGQLPEYLIRPLLIIIGVVLLHFVAPKLLTPTGALILNVSGVAIAFVVGAILLRRALPPALRAVHSQFETRNWLRASLPMMLISGIWMANAYAATLVVGTLDGPRAAGIYSVTQRGAELIVVLLYAANMPLAPAVARLYARGDSHGLEHTTERMARASLIVSIPVAAAFFLFPGTYLGLFGASFRAGSTALMILAVGQLVNATAGPSGNVLMMTGQESTAVRGVAAGLIANIVLAVILAPPLGVTGGAIAFAASLILWNVILVFVARRRLGVNVTAFRFLSIARSAP